MGDQQVLGVPHGIERAPRVATARQIASEQGVVRGCVEHDGAEMTPCVLAGPTCDSADVMYEKMPYPLPVTLEIGDKVLIEGTGAYTSTYSSVAFNGFPPLRTYHI